MDFVNTHLKQAAFLLEEFAKRNENRAAVSILCITERTEDWVCFAQAVAGPSDTKLDSTYNWVPKRIVSKNPWLAVQVQYYLQFQKQSLFPIPAVSKDVFRLSSCGEFQKNWLIYKGRQASSRWASIFDWLSKTVCRLVSHLTQSVYRYNIYVLRSVRSSCKLKEDHRIWFEYNSPIMKKRWATRLHERYFTWPTGYDATSDPVKASISWVLTAVVTRLLVDARCLPSCVAKHVFCMV